MLKPEQAQRALDDLKIEDWEKGLSARVARLPKDLRATGQALLDVILERRNFRDWEAERKAGNETAEQVAELSVRDRIRLFEAVFPRLAVHVEAGWQLLERQPYQRRYDRKAFRAPNTPAVTRNSRFEWLSALVTTAAQFDQDLAWYAAWAAHLSQAMSADELGILFAAAIDAGGPEGDQVFEILCDSARGEHDIGSMGRHVTRALLVASRPDGWEFIEKMLLAAQRQEGLRQTILETIDEAHPEAFRRMLRLIVEHDLARFSATVRALDVWFGFSWDAVSVGLVNRVVGQVLVYLEEPHVRQEALKTSGDGESVYLALWALAFEDAVAAIKPAAKLLDDPLVERRFAAVHLLGHLDLPEARRHLVKALEDDDLRVVLHALEGCRGDGADEDDADRPAGLFERSERILARMPEKKTKLDPIIWPWQVFIADPESVAAELVWALGDRPPTKLIPYLRALDTWQRAEVVGLLAGMKKWDAATRDTLFALAGDPSGTVREAALEGLKKCKVTEAEAQRLEGYLSRKANDLRRGVLTLLLNQGDEAALASAERLLASADLSQRLGGLEILRQMTEAQRQGSACRRCAEQYRSGRPRLTAEETRQLDAIQDTGRVAATLDDALGLLKPEERTPPVPPKKRKVTFMTATADAILRSLDALVHEHRDRPITVEMYDGPREELLGNLNWGFPDPDHEQEIEKDVLRLPLRDIWESWWEQRPAQLRDRDGLELLRASVLHGVREESVSEWRRHGAKLKEATDTLVGNFKPKRLRYSGVIGSVLVWLIRLHPPENIADFVLDAVETSFALVPEEELHRTPEPDDYERNWREHYCSPFLVWRDKARWVRNNCPAAWRPEHHVRLWRLLRWFDEPGPGQKRLRPELSETVGASVSGGATEADLIDQLLGPRDEEGWIGEFGGLWEVTERKPSPLFERCRLLADLSERCRRRILEVELQRGDSPTAATVPALALKSVHGQDNLVRLLHALGKDNLARGRDYQNLSRSRVFTHLIEVTHPAEAETPAAFARRMRAEGFAEQRLIDLAFHAPQWVRHVEAYLGWPEFPDGVWWFIAHARDADPMEDWDAVIGERTRLTREELAEGAVDVAWFHRVFDALGPDRWERLSAAAKYASWAMGYKRAQFLADVLLGKAKKTVLVQNIRQKHARESVRALGLLPLVTGAGREKDLLDRFHVLQEYHRYAKQLGAMSKEGALRAADIGMQNLARTAGYTDPMRFQWAMEAKAIEDLAEGPATIHVQGIDVLLRLDAQGQPELAAVKDGKTLKSIPPAVKKHTKVKALAERKTELKRQVSRMRQSLEQMMCRGDTFTGAELRQLFDHPVLAPLLERLVLQGEGILGYPVSKGQGLRDHAGKVEPVKKDEVLRVAHPHDLLRTKQWHKWQHDCFSAERVQPFKQVFRELYVVTEAEKADGTVSRRYAGQQINPRQAMALWGSRGWLASEEEGVRRTFHDAGITVAASFLGGWFTPAEVEGLTIEGVSFARVGAREPLPVAKVPPRIFSEAMRDLDLVVSVAHRGGVDPEASASTVQMRAVLLRETCELLGLGNVRVQDSRALIKGELSDYSVHLGSAVTHRQPGGALCLVPVHSQHRGRLFLPFADNDPKTAEVISKVLLLARDAEIKDPNILDQLRS
jgi:HEAT repeat protein